MKKFNLLALSIFAVALWSCTDKNDLGGNVPDGDVVTNYLSVSIVPSMETGTRATTDGGYEFGSAMENAVKNVRFYFFDASGNAQAVKRNKTNTDWDTYYQVDVPPTTAGDYDADENVEKIIDATLVLESPKDDKVPASLVAIVNYDNSLFDSSFDASTIEKLLANTGKYDAKENYGANGILMSSSVYTKANGTIAVEVKLTPENFKETINEAIKEPVIVYVERAVAKVSFDTDGFEFKEGEDKKYDEDGNILFPLVEKTTAGEESLTINGEQIYVKFLGWNVTQIVDKSFALKNLDPTWTVTGEDAPFTSWTHPAYYRSYWAKNPTLTIGNYHYTDFDGSYDGEEDVTSGKGVLGISDTEAAKPNGIPNYTYVHENAPQGKDEKRTEVLVAAKLVDENGNTIELAEFNGFKFMGENYQEELKKAAANMINVWKKTVSTDNGTPVTKYESIWKDLKVFSAREAEQYKDFGTGSYWSYIKLADSNPDTNKNVYVYYDENDEEQVVDDLETLNNWLLDLPDIKVWKEGNTYYFVDIEHLNYSETETKDYYPVGKYGVVRNHWYKIGVSKVYGLGTPVFNPSEKIIPENPDPVQSYLAAEIRILSWKIVKQETVLGQ